MNAGYIEYLNSQRLLLANETSFNSGWFLNQSVSTAVNALLSSNISSRDEFRGSVRFKCIKLGLKEIRSFCSPVSVPDIVMLLRIGLCIISITSRVASA